MMANFIEVTHADTRFGKNLINIDHVTLIRHFDGITEIFFDDNTDSGLRVKESYEEIRRMVWG